MGKIGCLLRHRPGLHLLALFIALVLAQASPAHAAKPHIVLIATGGTIASIQSSEGAMQHRPGALNVQDLIATVPRLTDLADITGEQLVNIDSQDMTNAVWLKLARRVNDVLKESGVDGVVITHGSDTMEETAYFLNLVVKSDKPVVVTGAMRASNALGADGPLNVFNAVALAASAQAKGHGVLIVMNEDVYYARDATKLNNMKVEAFESPNRGPAGLVMTGRAFLFPGPTGRHTTQSEFDVGGVTEMPRVEIVYAYANMGREFIDYAVQMGAKGIVIAGVGNGNMSQAALDGLAEAAKRGVAVVRSSRTASGVVARNIEENDDALGSIASVVILTFVSLGRLCPEFCWLSRSR